jgi:inorganic triphosphatase YgiF
VERVTPIEPGSPSVEVELKLEIPPRSARRLAAHRLLRGVAAASRHRLHSIYFDTPRLDLWRQGMTLRLRRDGGRWFQAVKGGGRVVAGLHRRIEHEMRVAGPALELSRFTGDGLAEMFSAGRLGERLQPVFSTDVSRSHRVLELAPRTRVEASVDRGWIRCGSRSEPLVELELELKSGPVGDLFGFAHELVGELALRLENRSKAERGYALYRRRLARPVKARPAMLAASMPVRVAIGQVMGAGLAHLQANMSGVLAGEDPEYLHQMRVALRRLRSALGVFRPVLPADVMAPIATELKWLASSLGPARDWDVFLTETLPAIEKAFGSHGELKALRERCSEWRRQAGARARRAVRSVRCQRLLLSLAAWLEAWNGRTGADSGMAGTLGEPVGRFAARVLERRHEQVRKRGRQCDTQSSRKLHQLRIAVKKFRYATDFFAGIYEGKPVRRALAGLSGLQDILGAINDAATVTDLVARGFEGVQGGEAAEARGVLLGWSRGRAEALRGGLKQAWRSFRAARRFWQ